MENNFLRRPDPDWPIAQKNNPRFKASRAKIHQILSTYDKEGGEMKDQILNR